MRTFTFKPRKYSIIKLRDKVEYKIPSEYTVEEVERLMELQVEYRKLEQQEVQESIKELQVKNFYENIFNQVEIIFQCFQPEVTIDYLKKIITHNEALEIVGFFREYRNKFLSTESTEVDSKKKSKIVDTDLRELRRLMTFMVVNGFSLFELRKLYIDELYFFNEELLYVLEKRGEVEQGTYDKLVSSNNTDDPELIVDSLRTQLFKSVTGKK